MESQGRKLTIQHRIDHLERPIDLLADFGASQDNLAAHEDQQDDLGLYHAVDEARKQFGFVRAEMVMPRCETLQSNGELNVARPNNVLYLEIGELGVEAELLDDASVFARGKATVIFRLGTGDNHFARGKDESLNDGQL